MFGKCLVLPGSTSTTLKVKQVEPKGTDEEFEILHWEAYNANPTAIDPLTLPDVGMLNHQNVAAVLDFLKCRYVKESIYTFVDPLLVAINPFKNIGNATEAYIKQYRDASDPYKLPPHVFSIARVALENMHSLNKSQTIIVTGESGAGKTEATKMIMRYFACAKSGTTDTRIQAAVMAANPVLEAFGNAKTIRNNNSSRFGRFMQLGVAPGGGIVNGKVLAFLLEKLRVTSQEKNERSYHIFYQFLKCATPDEKAKFKLLELPQYKFLNDQSGGCYDAPGVDDAAEWKDVGESFVSMQLDPAQIDHIKAGVSAVLRFGNVTFAGKNIAGQDNAAEIDPAGLENCEIACTLLGVNSQKIIDHVTTTEKKIGTEVVLQRVNAEDAKALMNSLAKAIYDKLFQWIIARLNTNIEPSGGFPSFMGMLDIFGFEVFERNSLEQILINITNEFLQKNFVDIVFDREQKLYRDEGISTTELVWTDNRAVIDCLIGKKGSVFALLEDSCLGPSGSDEGLVASLKTQLKDNPAFKESKKNARENFIICHTIADITYTATGFLLKNKDILKSELMETIQQSTIPTIADLFAGIYIEKGKLAKGQLIASQFLKQLDDLMTLILSTEPHFIRCIKPNETKVPLDWNSAKVLNQLFSLSILEALQLKQLGYSYRRPFADFCQQFRMLDIGLVDSDMERKECSKRILERAGLKANEWELGKTMVFMKPEAMKMLAHRQREVMAAWSPTVNLIEAAYKRYRYREELKRLLPCHVRVQAHCRWLCYAKVKK
eukprot:GHVN01062146.1.p1 GENE.GHVN01062146.1~~GHVN01062146.1.p1  ORF type:complete len:775 (+),score=114.99 GHVN01062146.1:497-2821(+)